MKRPLLLCTTALLMLVSAGGCLRLRPAPLARLAPTVRNDMTAMAEQILEVEEILQRSASLTPGDYDHIVEHLVALETVAARLEPARLGHPGLAPQLPALRAAATDAVRGARQAVPSMEGFDRLRAVCTGCHANPL